MATNKENNTEKKSRPLLRAFIIFIAIIGAFILYAYAIDVTEINFTIAIHVPLGPRSSNAAAKVRRHCEKICEADDAI